MKWFDQGDLRLLVKTLVVVVACSGVFVGAAAVAGTAVRVFTMAAGG